MSSFSRTPRGVFTQGIFVDSPFVGSIPGSDSPTPRNDLLTVPVLDETGRAKGGVGPRDQAHRARAREDREGSANEEEDENAARIPWKAKGKWRAGAEGADRTYVPSRVGEPIAPGKENQGHKSRSRPRSTTPVPPAAAPSTPMRGPPPPTPHRPTNFAPNTLNPPSANVTAAKRALLDFYVQQRDKAHRQYQAALLDIERMDRGLTVTEYVALLQMEEALESCQDKLGDYRKELEAELARAQEAQRSKITYLQGYARRGGYF